MKPAFAMLALILAGVSSMPQARAVNADDFAVYGFDFRSDGEVEMNGRLLVPENYDPDVDYPLVIFFHGAGERGTDNRKQVEKNIANLVAAARERDFFVYAPQLPQGGWNTTYTEYAFLALGGILEDYNIDRQKIYVTGLSLGGGGVWYAVQFYSRATAGAVSVCGVFGGADDLGPYAVDEPVWAYHAVTDGQVGVGQTRSRVNQILAGNGQPALNFPLTDNDGSPYYDDGSTYYENGALRYTEYASGGHNIWNRVYGESHLYDWLLAQTSDNDWKVGDAILLDFGNTRPDIVDNEGRHWTGSAYGYHDTLGGTFVFPRLAEGGRSPAAVAVKAAFANHSAFSHDPDSLYEAGLANDSWVTQAGATETDGYGAISFTGLLPGGEYRMQIYAYASNDDGGRGRTARYQIGSATRDLDAALNQTGVAVFDSITTDSSGRIDLKVYPSPGTDSRYAHVGVVELTLLSEPSGPVNDPPSVDAGPDILLVLPEGESVEVTLAGQVTDDGLPAGSLSLQWTAPVHPVGAEPIFGDVSAAETTVSFHKAGDYTLRLTASDTASERSDEVRITVKLEGGPLGGEVLFSQNFDDSENLADYVASSAPNLGQFEDISAAADGGTWSIVNGRLEHARDGNAGSAGFQRLSGLGDRVGFVRIAFDLSVENTSNSQNIATLSLGDWDSLIANSSGGSNARKAFDLTIKGRGEGSYDLRLFHADGFSDTQDWATSATSISVIWYANISDEEQGYNGPDGYRHVLPDNTSDLWVNGELALKDVPRNNKHLASEISAFRFYSTSNQPVRLTFDNLVIYDQAAPPDNSYDLWLNNWFSPAEKANVSLSGPLADPDGDGQVNLLEYYRGGVPTDASDRGKDILKLGRDRKLLLERDPAKSSLHVELWSSLDLVNWELLASSEGGRAFDSSGRYDLQILDNGAEPASVVIEDPRSGGADEETMLFYQLRLAEIP